MMKKHKIVGIVQEHRWGLDGASWGGFSLYPISLRESIFNNFSHNAICDLIKSGDIIATIIALFGALTVMGLAVRDNARLQKENHRLRMRVRELNKQVELHA
jgi:hypothetical protein